MNATVPLIRLEGLTKVFYTDEVETHALAGIHLDIAQGEYVAISGPSGCGKSTLLSILGLLDTPTGGTYTIAGDPVQDLVQQVRTADFLEQVKAALPGNVSPSRFTQTQPARTPRGCCASLTPRIGNIPPKSPSSTSMTNATSISPNSTFCRKPPSKHRNATVNRTPRRPVTKTAFGSCAGSAIIYPMAMKIRSNTSTGTRRRID